MFAIDLLKFRRSYVWAVIFLVPSIAVGIGAATVSYTHLTLPTNREV